MGKNEHPVADRWGITLGKSPARQEKVSDLSRLPVADLRELAVEVQGEKKLPRGTLIAILAAVLVVVSMVVSVVQPSETARSQVVAFAYVLLFVLSALYFSGLVYDPERANRMWREKIEQELRRRENEASDQPPQRRHVSSGAVVLAVIAAVATGSALMKGRSTTPQPAPSTRAR